MKKVFSLLFFTILLAGKVQAQFSVEFQSQFCTYDMSDLKKMQDHLFLNPPVALKKVTSFPPYIGFKLSGLYHPKENIEVGLTFYYTSTGGRMQYKDYSGGITGDQLTHASGIGFIGRIFLPSARKIKVGFSAALVAEYTKLNLNNSIVIGSSSVSDLAFNSFGIAAIPSVILRHELSNRFFLNLDLGYHITVSQNPYQWASDKNYKLYINGSDVALKPGWDGLRAGIGLQYMIKRIP